MCGLGCPHKGLCPLRVVGVYTEEVYDGKSVEHGWNGGKVPG